MSDVRADLKRNELENLDRKTNRSLSPGNLRQSKDWHLTDRIAHELGRGDPFAAAVRETRMPMVISDPRLPDCPLVFVNEAFQKMSGYHRDEIIGRNCRFLQGPDTCAESVAKVSKAIGEERAISIDLLNYRKDGSKFWNALHISPVKSETGEIQYFFASQVDVTERVEAQNMVSEQEAILDREVRKRTAELKDALDQQKMLIREVDHRVKNNLAMIGSLIRLQARKIDDPDTRHILESLLGRVESMSSVHGQLHVDGDGDRFALGRYTRTLTKRMVDNLGQDGIALDLDVEDVVIDASKASSFGLILNELLTNCLKHAFPDGTGNLSVSVRDMGEAFRLVVADDGPGRDLNQPRSSSMGSALVERLSQQIGANTIWHAPETGTRVTVTLPKVDS
ncbi:MAG: PAS domain-containing protein [Pacificimonas sp.]